MQPGCCGLMLPQIVQGFDLGNEQVCIQSTMTQTMGAWPLVSMWHSLTLLTPSIWLMITCKPAGCTGWLELLAWASQCSCYRAYLASIRAQHAVWQRWCLAGWHVTESQAEALS